MELDGDKVRSVLSALITLAEEREDRIASIGVAMRGTMEVTAISLAKDIINEIDESQEEEE